MPEYYTPLLNVWGATATIIPIGAPIGSVPGGLAGENTAKTTVRTYPGASGLDATFTYAPGARTAWALREYYRGRGKIPHQKFNGSTESASAPDNNYWSRGDGLLDYPMSIAVSWYLTTTAIASAPFCKYVDVAGNKEWQTVISNGKLIFQPFDQSAGVEASITTDSALPLYRPLRLLCTYSGLGGASAANGLNIYVNGVAVAVTRTNNASYVAMENRTGIVEIGKRTVSSSNLYFPDTMLGGPLGPIFAQVELSADQVADDFNIHLAAAGRRFFDPHSSGPIRQ